MICASCNEVSSELPERCPACGQETLLRGVYRLEEVVGRGASGITYRAVRVADGQVVAVKELPFHRLDALKTHELFEREARILRQLSHPGIPDYLDDFSAGTGKNLSLYLVLEFIEGQNLSREMEGQRYREDEVLAIVAEILGILSYLHTLSPPIIHRDLKPSNVMRRPGGGLVLIDFGSVRDALKDNVLGGSTVAGTFGFMAPEQFQGIASPATDIYGLGVLAVVLLSRRQPDSMMSEGNELSWEEHIEVSSGTRAILGRMLAMSPGERARDAAALKREVDELIQELIRSRQSTGSPAARAAEAMAGTAPLATTTPPRSTRAAQEPHNLRATFAVVGAMLGVALLALCMSPLRHEPEEARCQGKPCQPVPRGLKDLRFGMSLEEARAALPELARARELAPEEVEDPTAILEPGRRHLTLPVPGPRIAVETTLGSFPATCELSFAVSEGLSRMRCRIEDTGKSVESHIATESMLLVSLEERYGPPGFKDEPREQPYGTYTRTGRWSWRDKHAVLMLESRFEETKSIDLKPRDPGSSTYSMVEELERSSTLILDNKAAEHESLVSSLEVELMERERKEEELERQKREELLRKARDELEGAGKGLGTDL